MKKFKNILGILSLAIVLAFMSGCSNNTMIDDPDTGTTVPQGKARLKINTENGEFQTPSTRATANETAIDDVWVLVFKGSDYNATFVEAVKSTGTESERYVMLTKSAVAHKLLVVANADAIINIRKASLIAGTTTLTAAISTLQYGNPYNATAGDGALANPQTVMPFVEPVKSIPMSEVLSVSNISSTTEVNATGTAGGGALELRRICAKVVVDGSAVFSKFKITQVAAYQGARSAVSLVPGINGTIESGGAFVNYHKGSVTGPIEICKAFEANNATINNTENFPVYVYESAGTANYIIIKAKFNNREPSYYKLRLAKENGTNYEIKRNYKYIFKIESVHNGSVGYPDLKAAIDGVESNIAGRVVEIKESNSTEIIDNGTYYLGCSNSEFLVYADDAKNNLTALTITTNATAAMIGGVNSITATGSGLSVSPTKINLNTGGAANVAETNVTITLTAAFTEGTITLKLGNLLKTITVRRQPMLGFLATSKEFATDYISGKVTAGREWLSLGVVDNPAQGSVQVTRSDQPGSIYLFTELNFLASDGAKHIGGEVYLARNNNQGRVKIYVDQNATFPAYPGVIGYDPIRGDLNLEGRGVMVYFKYGGIIAMYSGLDGDKWKTDGRQIAFNPTEITIGAYKSFPTPVRNDLSTIGYKAAAHTVNDARNGNGDPCRFIKPDGSGMTAAEVKTALASDEIPDKTYWKLPTDVQNTVFLPSTSTWTTAAATAAGDATLRYGYTFTALDGFKYGNFLPAPGFRSCSDGEFQRPGMNGYYWSSIPYSLVAGNAMTFYNNDVVPSDYLNQSYGSTIRCVRNVPPSFPAYPGVIGYDPVNKKLNLDGKGVMVYFKFGSLVAMYAGLNGDAWSSDDIAFNPSLIEDFTTYTSIPYANSTTFPELDIPAGLGDPCRLVGYVATEVPDNHNNGWRIPTDEEYAEFIPAESAWTEVAATLAGDATLRGGRTFTGIGGNFLPAAGIRYFNGSSSDQGTKGYYWSNSGGRHLYLTKSGASLNVALDRSYGFAIRCVRKPSNGAI